MADIDIANPGGEAAALTAALQALLPLQVVTIPLTADDINHLFSAPKLLVAAPGAGKAIIPIAATYAIHAGIIPFGTIDSPRPGPADITYGGVYANLTSLGGGPSIFESPANPQETITGGLVNLASIAPVSNSISNNTGIYLTTSADFVGWGAIATSTLNAGGSGYAVGDTGSVDSNNGTAFYVIDTVDGGGAVLTYHLTNNGNQYKIGDTDTYTSGPQPGVGVGFTVHITAITPGDGTGSVTIVYYVQDLP